jgi:hypothetical protein
MRFVSLLIGVFLAAALVAAPGLAEDKAERAKKKHTVVTIHQMEVHPKAVTISPDEVIGWFNYADETAQLSFPESVAEKFSCSSLRPWFTRTGNGRIVSNPIHALEFAPPCTLPSGRYPYKVLLFSAQGAIGVGAAWGPPDSEIDAEIIVK